MSIANLIGFLVGLPALVLTSCAGTSEAKQAEAEPAPEVSSPVSTPQASSESDTAQAAPAFSFDGSLTQGGWIRGIAPEGAVSAKLGDTDLKIGRYGDFFAAFDRDADGKALLSATLKDGRTIEQRLTIAPRDWDIQHVNVARRPGGSSEAFMKRRMPELEAIYLARQKETGAKGWQQDFIWPVKGRISGKFGSQRIYRGEPGSYHSGLDIAPGAGTPFVAPADGVVVLAVEGFSLEGNLLILDHGMGLNSAFLHMQSISVSEGDAVVQGQELGRVGSSGRATGPHLHWSLKWRGARLDPLLVLPGGD